MQERKATAAARAVLRGAISNRLCSAAVAEVGTDDAVIWREAFGALSFADDARSADDRTVFDLASLTKPVATTSVVLGLLAEERLSLDERVADCLDEWSGADRQAATIRDLLEHASGLPARLVDPAPAGRREFEHEICRIPLECSPREKAVYSDLGFILLGFVASDRGGAPLDVLFERTVNGVGVASARGTEDRDAPVLGFHVPPAAASRTAVTKPLADDVRRGRTLRAEVHDAYAAGLGGVAGHAGLFGCARGIGRFARMALRGLRGISRPQDPIGPGVWRMTIERSTVPGSSRALGWDTMLPTSSCGALMSPTAVGHVGFTGTSLWIDPTRDRYYVLLCNRAAGEGTLDEMARTRRAFHESLAPV
jgi:CubicO group peptidase (beta-lactamase class C family)